MSVERTRLRADVLLAADAIAPVWPLDTFIACNPLLGFEDRPFDDACATAAELFRAETLPEVSRARAAYDAGTITATDLSRALNALPDPHFTFAHMTITANELRRAALLDAWPVPTPAVARAAEHGADAIAERTVPTTTDAAVIGCAREAFSAIGVRDTLGDWCAAAGAGDVVGQVNERSVTWCTAFLDRFEAEPMPYRAEGFYRAWRRLAQHESDVSALARSLPEDALDALAVLLERMGIGAEIRVGYLRRHLAQLPGFAGAIKQRAGANPAAGIDLAAFLAMRLAYETAFAERAMRRAFGVAGTLASLHALAPENLASERSVDTSTDTAALLARIAALAGVSDEALLATDPQMAGDAISLVRSFDERARRRVWLGAAEAAYARNLLARLAPQHTPSARPIAQLVHCIDARSELVRRHIEAVGPYETLGFAGFFGFPLRYRPFDAAVSVAQAPALLSPKHEIDDVPRDPRAARRVRARRAVRRAFESAVHALEDGASAFGFVEAAGIGGAIDLVARTFAPPRAKAPSLASDPAFEATPEFPGGYTLDEATFYAEAALATMGLRTFAPIVVLCGHESTSVNNPFAAALDCGACGGNSGDANARTGAAIFNDQRVRTRLAERGFAIPASTWFVAALHDTTRDSIMLDPHARVPAEHVDAFAQLRSDLARACADAARERVARLPRVALGANTPTARAADWAQVRPEWGLARNAAFIIAPRALTVGADLDGRAFLHSYDAAADPNGAVLEQIMTAPLVVAEWINLQYYFSTVDNERFGSGDKIVHNPVAGLGVMSGNRSDLRIGLPLQSVAIGEEPYHEPLRLLAVVAAPRERIDAVIARQRVLQRLFHNRWVHLVAVDDGTLWDYHTAGDWIARDLTENVWNRTASPA